MATIKEVYLTLKEAIAKNPDKYILDSIICNKIKRLPIEYGNFLLGLINEYYVNSIKKRPVNKQDLVSAATKKGNILTVPYKGKTHDNKKAPQFEAQNLPAALEKMIAAFIDYVEIKE